MQVSSVDVRTQLAKLLIGQSEAVEKIANIVSVHRTGMCPPDRPVANVMLVGPTGSGKTKTVESLAEVLHGNKKQLLKVDCGEFQMDHEVAKLVGAPPGYLGHRETTPMLSQQKLSGITSDKSNLSLVLFDEIEKAAPSMSRILLGIMDKATLRLGDNSTVNFERSLIFLTSNLGTKEIIDSGSFGLVKDDKNRRKSDVATMIAAVKRRFSPEFYNRIDETIAYETLNRESLRKIMEVMLDEIQTHAVSAGHTFLLQVTPGAKELILNEGQSDKYGARELRRVLQRRVTTPLANMLDQSRIPSGSEVTLWVHQGKLTWSVDQATMEQLLRVSAETVRRRK